MLRILPCELVLQICEYLSFRDICNLQQITPDVNRVSKIIISKELQKFDYPITLDVMHEVTNAFCRSEYDFNKITIGPVKRIVSHVLQYYQLHGSVDHFPCKLVLFAFYKLLEIEIIKSYTNIRYNVHFLHSFTGILDDVTYPYFHSINFTSLTLHDMHVVSQYAVTLPILKKLFGVRFLDLSQTNFIGCCKECISEHLLSICLLKYNRPDDCFLSMNYTAIKGFLKAKAYPLYRKMEFIESNMVNRHVMIKHPYKTCYMPITSREGKRQMFHLRNTPPLLSSEYTQTKRDIYQCQRDLKRFFFS